MSFPRSRRIAVLAYDGVRLLDVAAPLEVFSTAGAYEVVLCSPGGATVTASTGTVLPVGADAFAVHADTVVVPGSLTLPDGPVPDGLVAAAALLAASASRVTSVCTGAFVLAEAGLLDGRRATTHWRHAVALSRRYPRVTVEPDSIYVRDGHLLTSAGVSAGIDLALALVEDDLGPQAAREVARDLVVFMQRAGGQSQFSVPARMPRPRHDALRAALDAVAADPATDHSAVALSRRVGLSSRQLSRLFRAQLDTTPSAYVEQVRLEVARGLLEAGESVTGAARRSGLGSDETLRRVFLRHLGVPPSTYVARFRSTR
ncbi:transcriptional regulator GlxA family with amidase domain [Kitasatospora sp. GAS204A]|uniref:GlxA family transcriptional regulator n=1 Tax=unclassified Kitasatospora TaxID=2633591 RepID=UPI00247705D7|nr:DJ-1/PfpI family protein [Kitasatospora sp. GAS204B]MDH6118119.1 transcriptional regulator GlxA family with amidase domain [Kitasatospora sp. GAS204B]